MAITVTKEPKSTVSGVENRWNAVAVPVVAEVETNLFPQNTQTTTYNITSVTDDGGFARLNFSGGPALLRGYIRVTQTSKYNGIYQVDNLVAGTSVTIPVVFDGTTSIGKLQLYYRNLRLNITVFSGFDINNELGINLQGFTRLPTLSVVPDPTNKAVIDASKILQTLFSPAERVYVDGNPGNRWRQFYLTVQEEWDSYTVADGEGRTTGVAVNIGTEAAPYSVVNAAAQFGTAFQGSHQQYVCLGDDDGVDFSVANHGKFMTMFPEVTRWEGWPMELSIVVDESIGASLAVVGETEIQLVSGGEKKSVDLTTTVERWGIRSYYDDGAAAWNYGATIHWETRDSLIRISELLALKQGDLNCVRYPYFLKWLNPAGGWDQWLFGAAKDKNLRRNRDDRFRSAPFYKPTGGDGAWETGGAISQVARRDGEIRYTVRSQYVTQAEKEAIAWVLLSPVVINVQQTATPGTYIEREVVVDTASVRLFNDRDNLFEIEFEVIESAPLITQPQ